MDCYVEIENEIAFKMHHTLTHKFNMDQEMASELSLELVEALSISNTNLLDFKNIYFS